MEGLIIDDLYEEAHDKALLTNFSIAKRPHANFHHKSMSRKEFKIHRQSSLRDHNTAPKHEGPSHQRGEDYYHAYLVKSLRKVFLFWFCIAQV